MSKDKLWDIVNRLDDLHMDALVLEGISNTLWNSMTNGAVMNSCEIHNNTAFCVSNMATELQRNMNEIIKAFYEYFKENKKSPCDPARCTRD